MAPNELRALADALHDASASLNGTHFVAARKSAAYLRTQADAQPVAWSDGLGSFIAADERVGDDPDILAYRVPLYTHPAPAAPAVAERGPWTADQRGRHVWVDSDDLTHDVRLVVNGDFESDDQKFAYAQEIARRLNAAPAAPQAEPKRKPACLWSSADDDTDVWETGCGHAFMIIDGTPGDNHMEFCCYCGRPLEQEIGGSDE